MSYDAIVIGSGPNGLAAGIRLAEAGASVLIVEGHSTIGGGMRTQELTLPGFLHDVCSSAHPMGVLSPYLRTLPLQEHGLRWASGNASVAHPMDEGPAILLQHSIEETVEQLGEDAARYTRLVSPFLTNPHGFLDDALGPLGIPRHPIQMLRFGLRGLRSATGLARGFRGEQAKALLAGCAAHSTLPLDAPITAALGLMFLITAHVETWPVAVGGSHAIAASMASYFRSLGGDIQTNTWVTSLSDLPEGKVYLFDTSPNQLASIAGDALPPRYLRRIETYRYGPAAFKIDYALDGPIPWNDARCLEASTVHVGGTMAEINASESAMYHGKHPEKPFVLMVQQSDVDSTRAPEGKRTGYAYCHVPEGSTVDMTNAIESQIERFAPGFRDIVLARHTWTPADFATHNPNYVGGAITGGVTDFLQFFARPVLRLNPYTTPNPRIYLCSASTPPGGGVHGMCGFYAAEAALKRLCAGAAAPTLQTTVTDRLP